MRIEQLENKKCFITGAANGIGRATAMACAKQGAVLFLTDVNGPQLQQVVTEIRTAGGDVAFASTADIAQREQIAMLAQAIHAQHGSMDVVMNIAGISIWGAIENLQHAHWQRSIEVNLMGPIHVIEYFIPEMIRAGRGGYIVNVSSAAGLFGLPWHAAYSASKFGLRGISEVLRYDLARHRIGVSLVCPGGVDTGLVKSVEIVGVDREQPELKRFSQRFQRHAVTPERAAAAIVKGIKHGRYMIFTSADIAVGYWFQRKFAYPYELTMRILNNHLHGLIDKTGR